MRPCPLPGSNHERRAHRSQGDQRRLVRAERSARLIVESQGVSMSRFALTKTLSAVSLSLVIGVCLVGLQGCSGDDPTGPGEDTPAGPSVSILAPTDGATVSGAVTISASATDADTVRFFVEGNEIGFDALDPYEAVWNTGTIANGDCVLLVRAIRGQQSAEDQVTVVVDNAAGTVIVSVSPATASVALGETQQFLAEVTGTANTTVTWAVDNGAAWGTIAAGGLYTAPGALPDPATATVRAASVADPSKSDTAIVTLTRLWPWAKRSSFWHRSRVRRIPR